MKRIIIVLNMLAMAAAAGNAQFFVEGSIGAQYWGNETTFYGSTIDISPLAGYRINKKINVGLKASLFRGTYGGIILDPVTGNEVKWKSKYPGWSLSVFDRYKLWRWKKFSFHIESSLFMSERYPIETRGSATIRNETQSEIGLSAFPLIYYDLSDKLSLAVSTAFLNLNVYVRTINFKDTGLKTKDYHCDFNVQSVIFGDLFGIGVGVIYYFNKKSSK